MTDSVVAGELGIPGLEGTIYFGPGFSSDSDRDALFADLDEKGVTVVWNVQDDPASHESEADHFRAAIFTPIEDDGVPDDHGGFLRDLDRVLALLRAGQRIYIHSAAGYGRTGLAIASLLTRIGIPAEEAVDQTQQATGGPETAQQGAFVRSIPPE